MTLHKFTVTAARGMLPLLTAELEQFGITKLKQEAGSVRFTGTLKQAYQVCLWSRVAVRVLMPIGHFAAETPEQLYAGIQTINWSDHIAAEDATLAVDFNSFRSKINHTQFGAQKVKDAIVDQLREQFGHRPSVDLFQPDLRVNVYLKHNQAIVSLDLSGDSLHKRGYRVQNTDAPLKENLAAAILLTAQWPSLARQGWGLVDPMCGSGTFLIEAAMMAADIAPGMLRDYFGFLYWPQHDKTAWHELKADAERRRLSGLARLPVIKGGDQDPQAVKAAQANIAAAGLAEHIEVSERRLLDWTAVSRQLPNQGLLVCNPPYGTRMGNVHELHFLFESIGNILQENLPAWRSAVITDNASLGKFTGLTLFDQVPFDNGPIACEVLYYRAVDSRATSKNARPSASAWPQANKYEEEAETPQIHAPVERSEQAQMFANRLQKNVKHLAKWARKQGLDCYRVYDADLPDYAVAIDIYGDKVHVQEYAPPAEIDPLKASQRLDEVMQIVPEVLSVSRQNVVLKLRQRQRGSNQYETQAALKQRFAVTENGLQFWVNLTDYLDTGLFLDHRLTRQYLMENARGKSFLNLFAYTGSGTVYAAAGGAASSLTVDMSNTYLQWAQDNLQLNQLDGQQHQFIRADVIAWLDKAIADGLQFDLVFVDPPTFSNSSKMSDIFDVQRDHVSMLSKIGQLVRPNGQIVFSTNRRDFKLDEVALNTFVIKDMTKATLPTDFARNPKIHYCWSLTKS
ncbi:bifunctional 23S rRNA (guanine(2069)-N(7))-methyltransferase RlmK/23S rRNA (guanine(2445)-N(2))-methyltransferase RlmL [Methylophaga sp. OBS3]|uniref:bifunctional 23S rRNA (guanine(2069)-N(7))-methyltransferase RlmK/23S rRNA (guanine(2445)-N(2))-methyltransferase RlmL n=1 Tax=Methylophaga sp. OBS3 TaxID=2991934 RepID=UPI0022540AF3|nr:bifunctional 23S rRNA (guanine(2069)-N(7))-methyltransferase RlmK/23S rRNA (guanine(2445)-N(2))-methyltransferase RlmL [Methylophaga sp. OBS3]MCX4189206.1 bifunctional 23S rRNA (guanine(2069)-N(7))-methyltransferase RlmK/23S rRNA (guanine(2445)-N(2))-methyltransferase RlmL [Methylophaga sp. OBS3]